MNNSSKLICPKCQSENTKKISAMNEKYFLGAQICKDCNYIDHWIKFCSDLTEQQKKFLLND